MPSGSSRSSTTSGATTAARSRTARSRASSSTRSSSASSRTPTRWPAGLLGPTPAADDRVKPAIDRVESLVRAKAAAHDVTLACRAAREDVVARFGLRTTPTERPSLARAEKLYVENCAVCHGAKGDADTERARALDPSPASFRDRERLNALAPFRVYNALTFGVPGTAMASFDALPPSDRWSLAFYVFRLGHEGDREDKEVAVPLADLAIRTDQELADALRAQGHPQPDAAVAHARREVAFQEPPAGVGIDATRRMIRQAVRAVSAGDFAAADRQAIDAYLHGFEPLEPRLGVRDAQATLAVEQGFTRLRGAIARHDASAAQVEAGALDQRLVQLGGGSATRPFVASFLIYFREGVEAALLVAALLAGLRRLGRSDASRYIHAGWLAALPAGLRHLVRPRARGAPGRRAPRAGGGRRRPPGGGGAVLRQLLDDLEGRVAPLDGLPAPPARVDAHPAEPAAARRAVVPRRLPRGRGDRAVHAGAPARVRGPGRAGVDRRSRRALRGGGDRVRAGALRDEAAARSLLRGLGRAAVRAVAVVRGNGAARARARRLPAPAARALPRDHLAGRPSRTSTACSSRARSWR